MDFSNRNILITGAADGLGFAVSKAFSEKKANLFLLDIDHKKLIKNTKKQNPKAKVPLEIFSLIFFFSLIPPLIGE